MPRGRWLTDLRPPAGAEMPAGLRLLVAAAAGAALSLSYTGLHLSIYSWVCIGILLCSIFGARPLVAFGCGFLHGLLFVLTSVPWIATVLTVHGGLSVAGGWGVLLLMAIAWGILVGGFAWAVHRLSRQSIELACMGAPFIWVTFEFIRAHLPEISFPWNLLGYPAAANLGLVQLTTITGDPACAREYVERWKDVGVDELILVMQMGTVPHELIMESLRTFAEKVMPHFT